MKQLKNLEEAEQILTEDDMEDLIQPTIRLTTNQSEMRSLLGKKFVLVSYQVNYIPSKTYRCSYDDEHKQYFWELINYTEENYLDKPTNVWAKSVRDSESGRATVYIHWDDPVDADQAHWLYSVVVKKKGAEPQSIYDGEIVGYSSVRNQYSLKLAFMDSVDIDTVDDRDILDNSVLPISKTDYYYYRVFAVTRYGKITGSDAFLGMLTWAKLQELNRAGVADHALALGDIVQISHSSLDPEHYPERGLGTLDFQVVAFDNAKLKPNEDNPGNHSITFMSCDVLFRGSFDHKEKEYAVTKDTSWLGGKTYYYQDGTEWKAIDITKYKDGPSQFYSETLKYAHERNPCTDAPTYGRNRWSQSNIRDWLNSEEAADKWFKGNRHLYDTYSDDLDNDGAIGTPAIPAQETEKTNFDGFLGGLESELRAVMSKSTVTTTVPAWAHTSTEEPPVEETEDFVFLPSYVELFGINKTFPYDAGVSDKEGTWFGIYEKAQTNTRMKTVLQKYNTTPEGLPQPTDANNQLASWYTRTPARMKMRDPGYNKSTDVAIDCVEIVTAEERQFDNIIDLGEDGATGRQAYMPATSTDPKTDIPRDSRADVFTPIGTTIEYSNNTAPGFVPCFVVA